MLTREGALLLGSTSQLAVTNARIRLNFSLLVTSVFRIELPKRGS